MQGEWGAGRGRSNKIVGPSCHRFGSSSGASVVYVPIPTLRRLPNAAAFPSCHRFGSSRGASVVYVPISPCADCRTPPHFPLYVVPRFRHAARGAALAVLSVCCSPHRPHLPAGRGLKSSATPPHPIHLGSALVSTAIAPYCRMNSCTQMAHRIVPQCPVGPGTFPSLPTSPFLDNFRVVASLDRKRLGTKVSSKTSWNPRRFR